jgi:hypothetical protein
MTHDSEQYNTPSQPLQAEDWPTKVTSSKFQTLPELTCVYGIDGKCSVIVIVTPQRLSILQDAWMHIALLTHTHSHIHTHVYTHHSLPSDHAP